MADEPLRLFDPGPPRLVAIDGDRRDPETPADATDRGLRLLDPPELGWTREIPDDAA